MNAVSVCCRELLKFLFANASDNCQIRDLFVALVKIELLQSLF